MKFINLKILRLVKIGRVRGRPCYVYRIKDLSGRGGHTLSSDNEYRIGQVVQFPDVRR